MNIAQLLVIGSLAHSCRYFISLFCYNSRSFAISRELVPWCYLALLDTLFTLPHYI